MFLVTAMASGAPTLLHGQGLEEPRLVVRGLEFEGNRAIDDELLRISIATSRSSTAARARWIRWLGIGEKKYLDETEFRRDVLRLILLYRVSGYLQVRVDTVVRRTSDAAHIRFLIHEGPPVLVRSIDITGTEGIVPVRDLLHDIPLAVGEPFNRLRFEWAADTIRVAARNRGHPFAQVFRSYDVNEDSLSARVRFELEPGVRSRVDSVIVEGTQDIAPDVVRRMIPLRRGAWFSQSALYRSQRDLYRLGVFGYVNVALADSVPDGTADSSVAVRVQVTEGRLRSVRLGAGYGTVDCFRALASWSASNVLGGGRVLDVTARVSKLGAGEPVSAGLERWLCPAIEHDVGTERFKLNYNVTASFQEPYFFSRLARATLSVTAEQHTEILAYLRRAFGASVSITRETPWDIPVTVGFSRSRTETFAEPAVFCVFLNVCSLRDTLFSKPLWQSAVSALVVRDRTNSVLDPTRGSRFIADARYSSGAIGSDELAQFAKGVAELAVYHPLGRRTTFAWRVRGGAIVSPRLALGGQEVGYIPPSERFFAGGANSLRGFGQNQMGPVVRVVDPAQVDTTMVFADSTSVATDVVTAATGGNSLLIANAELRFPLPVLGGRLGGVLFLDMGELIERDATLIDLTEMRFTPGAGLRIATPIGPVRFDVAFNGYAPQKAVLYIKEGQQLRLHPDPYPRAPAPVNRLQFHFSVGQAF